MSLISRLRRRLVGELMPPLPFNAHQHLATYLFSLYDEPHQPTQRLIDIMLDTIREVQHVDLSDLATRPYIEANRLTQWPGEHYKLLAAMVRHLQPHNVIEIGTHTGWSALALKKYLPSDGRISTFDIKAWDNLADTVLNSNDFADGRLVQYIDDLADPVVVAKRSELLTPADIIFLDGPHDGPTEEKMMANFRSVPFSKNPLFVFDDIRMCELLQFWRNLALPKLDITSFGHFSGTGIAEWKPTS